QLAVRGPVPLWRWLKEATLYQSPGMDLHQLTPSLSRLRNVQRQSRPSHSLRPLLFAYADAVRHLPNSRGPSFHHITDFINLPFRGRSADSCYFAQVESRAHGNLVMIGL